VHDEKVDDEIGTKQSVEKALINNQIAFKSSIYKKKLLLHEWRNFRRDLNERFVTI
jgi:hypothetical protein